jgi:hypothetical protein
MGRSTTIQTAKAHKYLLITKNVRGQQKLITHGIYKFFLWKASTIVLDTHN